MTEPKETHPEITLNSHHHHHHHHHQPLVQNASHHHQQNPHQQNHQHHHYHHSSLSASTTSTTTVTLMVGLILSTLVIALANGLQQQQPLPPISQILQDLVVEADGCGELHKDCHCGSIAQSPGSSLFTRLVYPNSSTVIEEYDDNVPYGYKLYRVYYQCADEENVLVGDNMRECAEGNWRGAVPRCVLNLRNSTKLKNIKFSDYRYRRSRDKGGSPGMTNESSTSEQQQQPEHEPINAVTLHFEPDLKMSPNGTFEIPLEEQPEKCISWGLFPEQVWSMTLTAPARIHYVRIKLNGDKIEDLHQSRDIAFEMSLKNITYVDAPGEARRERENGFTGRGDSQKGNKQQQQPQLNPQLQQQQQPQSLPEPVQLPNIEIRCRETFPKASQYVNSAQQKYSANYLVLDFLCEAESIQKSIFEYFFSYDYAIDQLYAGVIEIRFSMLNLKVSPTSTSSRPTATSPEGGKAEGKSTSESSSGSKGADEVPHEEIELAQKIFAVRLCALKVYAFHTDCGSPDVPVNAIVQREYNFLDDNERKTYKYICNDKNQELKGNSFVECGYYSRWKNEFPQCVRFRPCELLSEMRKTGNSDYVLDVTYEALQPAETIIGGGGGGKGSKGGGNSRQVVPNGKSARFRCVKRSSMMSHPEQQQQQQLLGNGSSKAATVTPPANVKASHVMYEGVTAVVCRNGQWVGLESAVNAHHCISVPSRTVAEGGHGGEGGASGGPSVEESGNRLSTTSSTSAADPDAVVSLPIRLIRILFALFIILCLIIVALLVYMFIFRQQMNSYHHNRNGYSGHGSGKGGVNAYNFDAFDGIGNHHHLLNSSSHHLIPTIMYNGGADNGSSSGGANGDSSEIIYCTESNVYERISLEQEEMIGGGGGGGSNGGLHFYQTIKVGGIGGGGGGGDSNYSEMGTYPSSLVNEERENSIYGMEDDDDEDEDGNGGSLRMIIPRSGGGGRRRSSANSAVDNSVNHNLTQQQLNVVRNAAAATAAAAANNYNQLDRSSSMFMKSNSIYENNSGSGEQQQQYH